MNFLSFTLLLGFCAADHAVVEDQVPADAEIASFNGTVSNVLFSNDGARAGEAISVSGRVVVVDFSYCQNILTRDQFYKGFVTSFQGYEHLTDSRVYDDWSSMKLNLGTGVTTSSGPMKLYNNQWSYTWEYMPFPSGESLLNNGAVDFNMQSWNGFGYIYLPLLAPADSQLGTNRAYMLMVTPTRAMMGNPSLYRSTAVFLFNKQYTYEVGKTNYFTLLDMWVKPGALIDGMQSNFSATSTKFWTWNTIVQSFQGTTRRNYFPSLNNKYLMSTTKGSGNQHLCGYTDSVPAGITFEKFAQLVRAQYPWISW